MSLSSVSSDFAGNVSYPCAEAIGREGGGSDERRGRTECRLQRGRPRRLKRSHQLTRPHRF